MSQETTVFCVGQQVKDADVVEMSSGQLVPWLCTTRGDGHIALVVSAGVICRWQVCYIYEIAVLLKAF